MTLSGMTPAEQVRHISVDLKDAQPGDEIWNTFYGKWTVPKEEQLAALKLMFPDSIKPCRRLDPSIDPLAPLREELREAHKHLSWFRDLSRGCMTTHEIQPVIDWLTRNAAFGPGKGEGK